MGVSGVVNDIYFYEDGENVLAMNKLVEAGWTLHVETASAGLHHETTHTLIFLEQIRGRYYVTERDLDYLSWTSVQEVQEENSVELELDDEELPLLIDVIDAFRNCAREHEHRCLKLEYNLALGSLEVML